MEIGTEHDAEQLGQRRGGGGGGGGLGKMAPGFRAVGQATMAQDPQRNLLSGGRPGGALELSNNGKQ